MRIILINSRELRREADASIEGVFIPKTASLVAIAETEYGRGALFLMNSVYRQAVEGALWEVKKEDVEKAFSEVSKCPACGKGTTNVGTLCDGCRKLQEGIVNAIGSPNGVKQTISYFEESFRRFFV